MDGATAASSSSNSTRKKYHVFISFRGEDTRKAFTSDLYDAFCAKKIKAYIDEESLRKGDEISSSLLEAIEESEISVIILSENYGSSRWCLDELNHIVRCKETNNQIIVPVFYHVDPSDVRNQQGSYASLFAAHEERFKDQKEKVQQWRNSLTTVANLSGFHSSNYRSDTKLLGEILEDILKKLHRMLPCDEPKDLVGIEKRIKHVESFLNIDSLDVCIVGIWGMGGIGKTTLARAIFSRFASQFEGYYFLENVKEESKKHGLVNLQKKLFSKILAVEKSTNMVSQFVKDRLRCTKVLLILDNVDDEEQLKYLAKDRDWFGRGSKIIITTRDRHVLSYYTQIDAIYEVEELDFYESHHLLCSEAFRQSFPLTNYKDLSERVVHYSKGIPLVLTVLGSHLRSKSTEQWESELDKLKKTPNEKVHEVLKISYDGLECNEKEIFLDIACFFKGEDEEFVKKVLNAYGNRFTNSGVQVLIDKALITNTSNKLHMHDLLQEMGWKIICQESEEPGERSRLWSAEDIFKVLKHNTGTKFVQGISLETCDLTEVIRLNPKVFKKMYNLKYLKFSIVGNEKLLHFPKGLECLPDELRYLFWMGYPLKSLPSSFKPTHLVELHLTKSKLNYLWKGVPNLENLKILDLYGSHNLIQVPNLSRAVNLEKINLASCKCLENLPSGISKLESLQSLDLTSCSNINKFPELPVSLKSLTMKYTSIEEVVPSIECLSHLERFDLEHCKKLKSLPITICKLKSLQWFFLSYCVELDSFPEILEPMEHLIELDLRGTGIRKLPSSIEKLVKLQRLCLNNCKNLQLIPNTIFKLGRITFLSLSNCRKLENFPPFSKLPLRSLKDLNLDNTSISEIPFSFFFILSLQTISLCQSGIRTIPESIKFSNLRELNVMNCKSLQSLPQLPFCIKKVSARGCTSLQKVSNSSIETFSNVSLLLTKGLNYVDEREGYYREELEFIDCSMLDQKNIITEFQTRALCLGTEVRAIPKQMKANKRYFRAFEVSISFPGDEIPKWFNYQNQNGCSINMKLATPHCYDTANFIGFASCVVVSLELIGKSAIDDFSIFCCCYVNVKTNNNPMCLKFGTRAINGFKHFSGSNHVLMRYFHTDNIDLSSAEEISFNFHIFCKKYFAPIPNEGEEEKHYPTFKVKRCGIRMLRLQDLEEHSSEFARAESNVVNNEVEPSGLEISDLETNVPHPKRPKFSSSFTS